MIPKNNKLKICFVSLSSYAYFHPELEIKSGGAEKQIYKISTLLAQNSNFEVSVCVADYGQKLNIEPIQKLKLIRTISYKDNKIKALFTLLFIYKKMNADIYIFRTADLGIGISISFIKIFLRKKILYFSASDAETSFKQTVKMYSFLTALSMSIAYRLSDKIIAQTKEQALLFSQNRKIKSEIIKSIYQTKESQQKVEKNTILWIGRNIPWKQPKLFLKLAKAFPALNFVMIAPTNKSDEKYAQKLKSQAKAIKNIQFIDYIATNKINEYYHKALILINTSINEGFSNVMLEAMNAQCALLSLNANPDDFINKNKVGYFTTGNFEILKIKLKMMWDDKAKTLEMGRNGKTYLQKNHHAQKIKKQIEILILETINNY